MRNLIMLATIGGVTFLTAGASAAPIPVQPREPIMQQADWYAVQSANGTAHGSVGG